MPLPFCAEESHQATPLDTEVLRHRHHERVALRRADHREADARVATGRLDDRLPRLQQSLALGVFDHTERESILDRAHRVEGFELHVQIHVRGRQPVQPRDGRVPDRLEDSLVTHRALPASKRSLGAIAWEQSGEPAYRGDFRGGEFCIAL